MSTARLALAAARPYVSAAVNTGGGRQAMRVLEIVDQALAELKPAAPKPAGVPEGGWEPPGGWPPETEG
jgi:hypothetical protein